MDLFKELDIEPKKKPKERAPKITRFGVSLPSVLVNHFDKAIHELGYKKRSQAIADALIDFMAEKKIKDGPQIIIGSISYIYDHHTTNVNETLVELQHGYEKNIKSTMHSHLSHRECVEVMIVEGGASEIQKLFGGLSAIRGVQKCKLNILLTK